jgi:hypothetical protein
MDKDHYTTALQFSVTPNIAAALIAGVRRNLQILADYISMQTKIHSEFWAELTAPESLPYAPATIRLSLIYRSGDESYETFTLRKFPRIGPSRLYRVSSFGSPCPANDHRAGRLRRLLAAEAGRPAKDHFGRPAGTEAIRIGRQRSIAYQKAGRCVAYRPSWLYGPTLCWW